MIEACPVCGAAETVPVWRRDRSPIFQLLPIDRVVADDDFEPLEIVRCSSCRHVFNKAFDAAVLGRMYRSETLSNVPVNPGMLRRLEGIADWLGRPSFAQRKVVEIGGGSGGVSRVLARAARDVVIFEPSRGIAQGDFAEDNITLVPEMFSVGPVSSGADLVICRHVLEHTADPRVMLDAIRASLAEAGSAYVEVPNLDYIDGHAALFDFHCAHVQYFSPANLARLAASVGLFPSRQWMSPDGRDFGLLLGARRTSLTCAESPGSDDLAERLSMRHDRYEQFFHCRPDQRLLYGATWNGLAFLNAFANPPAFPCVLDDNESYAGLALYHPRLKVPVRRPDQAVLAVDAVVLITSYHHAAAITSRLRGLGFPGLVLSVAEDPEPRGSRY